MRRPSSWGSWFLLWLTFFLFGLVPAMIVELTTPKRHKDHFSAIHSEARGRALLLDAHLRRWITRAETVAQGLSTLFAQLPDAPLGSAAEGTLMLHLQQQAQKDQAIDEYSVLSSEGKALLSTDGTRVGLREEGFDEISQAANRSAVALIKVPKQPIRLVIGVPIKVGQSTRAILLARPSKKKLLFYCSPTHHWMGIDLVDASGHSLTGYARKSELLDLGSESQEGKRMLPSRRPVAFVPLQTARAVVLVIGPAVPLESRATTPLLLITLGIFLASGFGAWLWSPRL